MAGTQGERSATDRKEARAEEGRGPGEGGQRDREWRREGSADDETGTCGREGGSVRSTRFHHRNPARRACARRSGAEERHTHK